MFEKSLEVLNSKVSDLQKQLLAQIEVLETAKVSRKTVVEKVDSLIRTVYEKYGIDGLNDVTNAIALFISQQEDSTAAKVPAPVVEVPAPVVAESVAEAPTPVVVKPKTTKKKASIKSNKEVPVVPSDLLADIPAPEPITEAEDNRYRQSTIFETSSPEQEIKPADIDTGSVETIAPQPQAAHLNLEKPTWINFDQKAWLKEREGIHADELPCFYEEKITNLLRDGWSYNEIPLTYGTLSDGTVISPESPDPDERLAPVITFSVDGRIQKVLEYGWLSKTERSIMDKMFGFIYGESPNEIPGWRKVLHVVERLTGLVDTADSAIEKSELLTPSGLIRSLSCGIVGLSVKGRKGTKTRIRNNEWQQFLIENADMSQEEIAYLNENFGQ